MFRHNHHLWLWFYLASSIITVGLLFPKIITTILTRPVNSFVWQIRTNVIALKIKLMESNRFSYDRKTHPLKIGTKRYLMRVKCKNRWPHIHPHPRCHLDNRTVIYFHKNFQTRGRFDQEKKGGWDRFSFVQTLTIGHSIYFKCILEFK